MCREEVKLKGLGSGRITGTGKGGTGEKGDRQARRTASRVRGNDESAADERRDEVAKSSISRSERCDSNMMEEEKKILRYSSRFSRSWVFQLLYSISDCDLFILITIILCIIIVSMNMTTTQPD